MKDKTVAVQDATHAALIQPFVITASIIPSLTVKIKKRNRILIACRPLNCNIESLATETWKGVSPPSNENAVILYKKLEAIEAQI